MNKLEQYQNIQGMVQQEIQTMFPNLYSQYASQYNVNNTPTHTHNGIDSVQLEQEDIIPNVKYTSVLGSIKSETFSVQGFNNLTRLDFNGYAINGLVTLTFTGTLASNATSGTLSANWTQTTGSYTAVFANNDVRAVTLTNGATTCTWSPGLSSNSAGSVQVLGSATSRAIINGIGMFGKCFTFQSNSTGNIISLASLAKGVPLIQNSNAMYFDAGGQHNAADATALASVLNTSSASVAKMVINSYQNNTVIITTTLSAGWYIIGTFTMS